MDKEEWTTIPLTKKTRERLKKIGIKGESWDKLLNKIMDKLKR